MLVEQNVIQSLEIATRAYVMENGVIQLEGASRDLMGNQDLRKSYLGM
jgi:branched-chain amino acid transport system ATP-binding protein